MVPGSGGPMERIAIYEPGHESRLRDAGSRRGCLRGGELTKRPTPCGSKKVAVSSPCTAQPPGCTGLCQIIDRD